MKLLEDIKEYTKAMEKRIEKYEGTSYPDMNRALLECNSLLIPLEITVRKYELQLKRETIQLKMNETYKNIL